MIEYRIYFRFGYYYIVLCNEDMASSSCKQMTIYCMFERFVSSLHYKQIKTFYLFKIYLTTKTDIGSIQLITTTTRYRLLLPKNVCHQ